MLYCKKKNFVADAELFPFSARLSAYTIFRAQRKGYLMSLISRKANRQKRHDRLVSAAFLAPSILGVAVFFVVPFFVILYYAFINNPVQKEFVGFDNFVRLFSNYSFKIAVINTLRFSAVCVPLAVITALLLAMALNVKIPLQSRLRSAFLSPMMVPVASIVLIWQVLFHYNGSVNTFLEFFSLDKVDWMKSTSGIWVIVLLFLWKNLGYNMILFLAALNNIPKDILEVATVEGAGPVRQFFTIKIRYLSSTILFVTILSVINSFKIFREIYLLSGDYPYESLYMLQHFMNNTFSSLDYQKLSAAAILMAIFMCILIGGLFYADDLYGKDVEE